MTTITRKVWCEKTRQYLMMTFEIEFDPQLLPISAMYRAARSVQGMATMGEGMVKIKRVGKGLEKP